MKTAYQPFSRKELRILRGIAEKQADKMKGARYWRNLEFFLYLAVVIVLAFGVRSYIAEPIRVSGSSMVPTLSDGEHMFVEQLSYWTRMPERGEIIICYYPSYEESCVKRVIGLPGETVSVHDGKIHINGEPIDELPYWGGWINGEMDDVTVGEREIFVVGDNRNGSKDSRNPSVGCIPMKKVLGRVRAVIWPINRLRGMEEVSYS